MAKFKYQGRDLSGKKTGVVTAQSKKEAMFALREKGIKVIDINEVPETLLTKDITLGNPVKLQHFVIFLRQFSTLLKAGVSIVDSVVILAQQTESKALKKVLASVEVDLREGIPLSDAAEKHKKVFSNMFINMVRAGEASGQIDETLERMADYFEKQHDTKQKIISALIYPLVLTVVAIAVTIFLLVSVVPTFVDMFSDFGGELPGITQFVLSTSEFMQVLLVVHPAVGDWDCYCYFRDEK